MDGAPPTYISAEEESCDTTKAAATNGSGTILPEMLIEFIENWSTPLPENRSESSSNILKHWQDYDQQRHFEMMIM